MPNLANNKIVFGDTPVIDLTSDSAIASDIADGVSFHLSNGTVGIGTATFGTGATVSGNNISMDGTVRSYVIPDWATCTDEELEEAIALSIAKGFDLKAIWNKQTGVTWADGTDAQIARALDLYYRDYLSLTNKWQVGDERVVNLSAMSATGVSESHAAQSVTYVLTNVGGKTLATSINGHTTCVFQVDQKHCLNEQGYMNSTATNSGGWKPCARRTWCNSVYKNAIPSTLRGIFKEFINKSGTGGGSSSGVENTTDTFALRAEIEVLGTTKKSVSGEGSQVTYYQTSSNRIKQVNGSAQYWWTRSATSGRKERFLFINNSGVLDVQTAEKRYGLAPFGAI